VAVIQLLHHAVSLRAPSSIAGDASADMVSNIWTVEASAALCAAWILWRQTSCAGNDEGDQTSSGLLAAFHESTRLACVADAEQHTARSLEIQFRRLKDIVIRLMTAVGDLRCQAAERGDITAESAFLSRSVAMAGFSGVAMQEAITCYTYLAYSDVFHETYSTGIAVPIDVAESLLKAMTGRSLARASMLKHSQHLRKDRMDVPAGSSAKRQNAANGPVLSSLNFVVATRTRDKFATRIHGALESYNDEGNIPDIGHGSGQCKGYGQESAPDAVGDQVAPPLMRHSHMPSVKTDEHFERRTQDF
jgi:hypothetical protein